MTTATIIVIIGVSIVIQGIISNTINSKQEFKDNFYNSLSNFQIKKDINSIFNKIIKSLSSKSNYKFTGYKDYAHLQREIEVHKKIIEKGDITTLYIRTSFHIFSDLAEQNKWNNKQLKLLTNLNELLTELQKREKLRN